MAIDREFQLKVLKELASAYPEEVFFDDRGYDQEALANLFYLYELGLIDATESDSFGQSRRVIQARITASGHDFLAEDGGISAILGTVTVKLHADTIRALLSSGIEQSKTSDQDKQSMKHLLQKAPEKLLSSIIQECVSYSVRSAPELIAHLLRAGVA